jgi:outer membrane immunogenic protein
MNRALLAAAALLCPAAPAFSGGPTIVEDSAVLAPMPDAKPGPDWTGAYAGLSLGRTSGDLDYENPDSDYDVNSGSLRSFFLGYRIQQGDLVYGGELELANLSGTTVEGFSEEFSKAFDVKGSLGYAKGRFLTYGVVGWSQVSFERAADSGNFGGISYGAGIEYSVNNTLGLGLEYLARDVDGVSLNGSPQTTTIGANSLSLRLGLSF